MRKARLEVEDTRHCTIPDKDLGKDSRREERGNVLELKLRGQSWLAMETWESLPRRLWLRPD